MVMKPPSKLEPKPEDVVLNQIHLALERDLQLDPTRHPITLSFADGVLTMEGEVSDVAAKTRALRRAAAVQGVRWVVDRLCVQRGAPAEDGAIRDHVRNALLADTAFAECKIVVRSGAVTQVVHDPLRARGSIDVTVAEGMVTLDGEVPSPSHRRLAGVYAWWTSGTRNVHNRLGVTPPEEESDDEISDAVRLALEKDPLVNAAQIAVRTAGGRVTIDGTVHTELEKEIAERDAWYVLGVDEVVNRVHVHP